VYHWPWGNAADVRMMSLMSFALDAYGADVRDSPSSTLPSACTFFLKEINKVPVVTLGNMNEPVFLVRVTNLFGMRDADKDGP
jgi:hypothetical protein